MLNKLIQILLIILFITLPLINSHLLDFFGLHEFAKLFYVDGNYEFTKVMYFNIFSGIILFLYFIKTLLLKNKTFIPKIIFPIIIILIISTIFSISPQTSLFGNDDKAHSLLMSLNLIGIFIILINQDYSFKKSILFWSVLGLFPVIYFALKEYIYPSYDYGDLNNRAIGTFGHPNYLALYLLLFVPVINDLLNKTKNIKKYLYEILLFFILISLFLTKSILAIFLFFNYLIYINFKKINNYISKKIFIILYIIIFLISIKYILLVYPEKLHSFISRFYLWETTINIIKSDFKTILIGNGLETLSYIFDSFKSPFLYIFENIGFTADRPHNIFLNIFYHTGILGLFILIYLVCKLLKYQKSIYKTSLILGLIFLCFNFASIASYLLIILFVSFLIKNTNKTSILSGERGYIFNYIVLFLITSFSVFGAYISYNFYKSEIFLYNGDFINANKFYKKQVENFSCKNIKIKSVENYFLCGNSYWKIGKKQKAIDYYNLGLKKLPDLWNKNSIYYNNVLIKDNPDILHRFYSEKYSNLGEILNRVGIKKNLEN